MNSPEIEAAFRNLITPLDLDSGEPIPLDSAVEALLDHFMELLAAAGTTNENDINAVKQKHAILTDRINRFISHSEELTYGTEISVKGSTIVLMLDEAEESLEINLLDEGDQIYGKVGGLYVGAIPDESVFFEREERAESDDEYDEVDTIPFGLALVLDEPILSDHNGGTQFVPTEMTICIPLNYSSLRLTKI